MSFSSNDGGDEKSEEYLLASLNSTRDSLASLEVANKELIEALESSQEEIERYIYNKTSNHSNNYMDCYIFLLLFLQQLHLAFYTL